WSGRSREGRRRSPMRSCSTGRWPGSGGTGWSRSEPSSRRGRSGGSIATRRPRSTTRRRDTSGSWGCRSSWCSGAESSPRSEYALDDSRAKGDGMAESVYRVTEVIGTSSDSWEAAAKNAVETAAKTLRDLRVGEVVKFDVTIENGKVTNYRARVNVSFKYEG